MLRALLEDVTIASSAPKTVPPSGRGEGFTANQVGSPRRYRHIPRCAQPAAPPDGESVTIQKAAEILGVAALYAVPLANRFGGRSVTNPRQPRVLMLGPAAPVLGGMAAVVDALGRSSVRDHFDLTIINTGKTTQRNRRWHVAVSSQLGLLAKVAAALLRSHARLVHIHTCSGLVFWRDTVFLLMARLFRAKVLWHIHGGGFEEFVQSMRGIRRTLLGLAFSMSEGVIVLSESWRMRLSRHLHPSRWMVVANGVTLPSPGPGVTRSVIFLFVGTLDNKKGAEDLVVATAIAKRNGFHGRVQMAGGETATGQRRRLQRLIAKAGVRERIELLGMVSGERKAAAFEEACVFVLPSYVEGLPIAVLEAMAYGLPVIVTEVGAIPEVVTDSVHGFLIKPGDVEALADCMTRLFADRALRERMGMAARRRIEERYTVEAMASKIIDVYRSAMEP